jgi:serine/threonine protein kinase
VTNPAEDPPPEESGRDGGDLPSGFLVGEYRIDRLLGRGGMGAVHAAEQPEIGARVAIKVLGAALSHDPRLVKRFVEEARVVNKIGHPNIIDVFAFGRLADGRQYFVMEYLEGETLASRLARGPVPVSEARRLLQQICEALEAAHQEKVIHRDLKPENLWIAMPRHGQPYAKVLDFGIAKLIESSDPATATETGTVMGTPHYMSPEQCRGEAVDPRTDIYAMGVILYYIWSGRLPFEGSSFVAVASQQITSTPLPPSAHRPVPPRLERLIMSCLEKDPALRPASAKVLGREIGEALAEALPGETTPSAGARAVAAGGPFAEPQASLGVQPGVSRDKQHHRSRVSLAVVALLVVLASGGAFLVARARHDSPAARPPEAARSVPSQLEPISTVRATFMSPPAGPTQPVALPPPNADPRPQAPPARPRARVAPGSSPERPSSRLEERGFLKENPFR